MKPSALPSKITSLLAFIGIVFLTAIAILTLLALLFTSTSHAGTISYGNPTTAYFSVLGVTPDNAPTQTAEFQQIYASSGFKSAVMITQIAFMSATNGKAVEAIYHLTLSLGVTKKTPYSTANTFATGLTPVLSGDIPVHFTAASKDYDMVIDLPTPFYYNPAWGNLLLDIVRPDAVGEGYSTRSAYFCTDLKTNVMGMTSVYETGRHGYDGQIYFDPGIAATEPLKGLVTQFTTAPVPEPATAALLALGAALCGGRRARKIRS